MHPGLPASRRLRWNGWLPGKSTLNPKLQHPYRFAPSRDESHTLPALRWCETVVLVLSINFQGHGTWDALAERLWLHLPGQWRPQLRQQCGHGQLRACSHPCWHCTVPSSCMRPAPPGRSHSAARWAEHSCPALLHPSVRKWGLGAPTSLWPRAPWQLPCSLLLSGHFQSISPTAMFF